MCFLSLLLPSSDNDTIHQHRNFGQTDSVVEKKWVTLIFCVCVGWVGGGGGDVSLRTWP